MSHFRLKPLNIDKGLGFTQYVEKAYNNKITPAKQVLETSTEKDICQLLTPIIPVQMVKEGILLDSQV